MGVRVACALLPLVLGLFTGGPAAGQDPRGPVPASPPEVRPGESNDPMQWMDEGYRLAEQQRQAAIARQVQLEDRIRMQNALGAQGYWPALPPAYLYGSPRAAIRAYRNGYPLVYAPWARTPADALGSYQGGVRQPTGHEKITLPNGTTIYRPRYDDPRLAQPPVPIEPPDQGPSAAGQVPPVPRGGPRQAAPIPPPPEPMPEAIPAPLAEPVGPQEL